MSEFKTKPYKHQRHALKRSDRQENFAYFMDTGTGKTKVLLDDAARAYRRGEIDTLLVLAPNSVYKEWVSEEEGAGKHLPDDIPRALAFYNSGYKRVSLKDALTASGCLRIIAVNIEAISRKQGRDFCMRLVQSGRCMVAIDESQRIKRPRSNRTKAAWRLGSHAVLKRLLSGSTLTKGWEDLYGQMRFFGWEILGCQTNTDFRLKYLVEVGPYRQIKGYRNVDELLERIKPYIFQVLLDDCVDMPKRLMMPDFPPRVVEMSDEQHHLYHTLRKKFMVEVRKGEILHAAQATTRLIRLQQIVNGFVPLEDGTYRELSCPRIERIMDDIRGFSGKMLVWGRFQPDIVRLEKALKAEGIGYALYYGPIREEQRDRNLARWRTDPNCPIFLATPQVGGVGLTLNEASGQAFYANSYNYEHRKQALGRNYRIGQKKKTIVFDYASPGTIDYKIFAKHEHAQDAIKKLTDARELLDFLSVDDD